MILANKYHLMLCCGNMLECAIVKFVIVNQGTFIKKYYVENITFLCHNSYIELTLCDGVFEFKERKKEEFHTTWFMLISNEMTPILFSSQTNIQYHKVNVRNR